MVFSCVVSLECLVRAVQASPNRPVHLPEDILLASAEAVQAAGWASVATRGLLRRRFTRGIIYGTAAAAIVAVHIGDPRDGGTILALATSAAGLALVRRGKYRPPEDLAILLIAIAACLSPIGPAAFYLNTMQRWTELSSVGFFAAASLAIAGVLVLVGTARRMSESAFSVAGISLRDDVVPLIAALGSWLTLGLVCACFMARLARYEFERSAIGRVSAAASLLNSSPEALIIDQALGPDFKPDLRPSSFDQPGGGAMPYTFAASLMNPKVTLVLEQLKRIAKADPDVRFVQLETIRDGKELTVLTHFLSKEFVGAVSPLRDVSPAATRSWVDRQAYFEGPVTLGYGEATFARAPVLGSNGAMLGWLSFVFGVGQWEAVQAEARLLTFSIAALGLALGLALFAQRIRSRERQTALQAAAAAEEANRLKTRFLASVSHELRTPIQAIMGYTELLSNNLADDTSRARVLLLRRQGELMARLVNDLIDLAALESGAFRSVEENMSLAAVVIETVESLRPRFQAKGVALGMEISGDLPHWVEGDSDRIGQLVMNLVGNAIKFTDHGRVDVILNGHPDDGAVVFELKIRDTGPGIPAAESDRLFKPFSRLSTSRNREGAGLGLALSAALCRLLDGDLTVSSDGLTGSEFVARFRLKSGVVPPERNNAVDLEGTRILIADDNQMLRELYTAYLREAGATCETACDGREALEKAMQGRFQSLVLDLSMPEMDGHQVARELRKAGRNIRIIGVSAHAGSGERVLAAKSGMDDFLTKPVELATLARALQLSPPAAIRPDAWRRLRSKWEIEFRQTIPTQIDGFQCSISSRSWAELQKRAHNLRNSAIVLQDDRLFGAFGALEDGAALGDEESIRQSWVLCASALAPWYPDAHTILPGDNRHGEEIESTKLRPT